MAKKRAHLKRKLTRTRKAVSRRVAKRAVVAFAVPTFALPSMKPGEGYAGVLVDKDGRTTAHLVEIAVRAEEGTHEAQTAWAKSAGGELPDRQESALLYANRKHAHQSRYYWTRETVAGTAEFAWVQYFGDGDQAHDLKGRKYLACAVRRVPI